MHTYVWHHKFNCIHMILHLMQHSNKRNIFIFNNFPDQIHALDFEPVDEGKRYNNKKKNGLDLNQSI